MADLVKLRVPVALLVAAALAILSGLGSNWPWLLVIGLALGIVGVALLGTDADSERPAEPAPGAGAVPSATPSAAPGTDAARPESLAPLPVVSQEVTELRALLQDALDAVAEPADAKGLTCRLELADFVPRQVMVDRERLTSMLVVLLERAVRITESGVVELAVEPDSDHLRFVVRDRSSGIPRTQHEALFDPDGPEPRVAEVRLYAEAMGGKAGVRSVLGEGSRFWFTVSMNLPETKVPDAPPSDPLG